MHVMNRTRVVAAFLLSPFAGAFYLLVLALLFDLSDYMGARVLRCARRHKYRGILVSRLVGK
jgi:hypothetical protein